MQLNTLGVIHDFLRRSVQPGSLCIDATAGKGRDTALLCRLAGPTGQVLAFDIQPQALAATRALLDEQGLSARLIQQSHAQMEQYAQPQTVDCVVFNLGRLPGGDPKIFTHADSTLAAVDAALRLLKPGGVLAIALYYGGENGYTEKDALLQHLKTLDDRRYTALVCDWTNRRGEPPLPILVWKEH